MPVKQKSLNDAAAVAKDAFELKCEGQKSLPDFKQQKRAAEALIFGNDGIAAQLQSSTVISVIFKALQSAVAEYQPYPETVKMLVNYYINIFRLSLKEQEPAFAVELEKRQKRHHQAR